MMSDCEPTRDPGVQMQPACWPVTEAEPTAKNAQNSIPRTHHPRGATHRLSRSPSVFRPESVWRPSPIECSESPHTDSGRNTDWHRDGDPADRIHAALYCSLCSFRFMPVSVRWGHRLGGERDHRPPSRRRGSTGSESGVRLTGRVRNGETERRFSDWLASLLIVLWAGTTGPLPWPAAESNRISQGVLCSRRARARRTARCPETTPSPPSTTAYA